MSPGAGSPRASWGGEGGPMGRPSDAGSRARTSQQHQQAAAAGQYSYESLDYEVVDNVVYRADEASCTHFDVIVRGGVKWLMCFLIGGLPAPAACQQASSTSQSFRASTCAATTPTAGHTACTAAVHVSGKGVQVRIRVLLQDQHT